MELISCSMPLSISDETIATIGFFDGVHQGHRYLLSQLKELAEKQNVKTSIITFRTHPRKALQLDFQPQLLNTFEEKIDLLSSLEIDYCYIFDFDRALSEFSSKKFMSEILRKQLNINSLLIGYDHKFGKNRTEGYEQYAEYGKECGIKVFKAKELKKCEKQVSSTQIRNLLLQGKIKEAGKLCTYPYLIQGKVIEGNKIGQTIGFPTANIELNNKKILPCDGVYAVYAFVNGIKINGMAYIGKRPTITNSGEKRIEVNLFDFNQDIYNQDIKVEFIDFIREDIRFQSKDELQKQLAEDKEVASLICRRELDTPFTKNKYD